MTRLSNPDLKNSDLKDRDRAARLDALLSDYAVRSGHFDELLDSGGAPRAAWAAFAENAGDLSAATLSSAQIRIARQIQESSSTHTVYAGADGRSRPWTLDVLPFIIPSDEWAALSRDLRRHARLLNALAADLYGPQLLLREGLIPPALVFRHPGFLRSCCGVTPPNGVFLHQLAFDLARDPEGRWRIVKVRTQAPAGSGYALENRATILRMFPDAFRALHVQPVAPYFAALKDALITSAPCDERSPHIVLLTPGPYSGRYFEHAYLARYLGFPLVEGADLTVRNDRVFLKTISGLRQVHGILRHVTDDYCDPLELRSDSTLGVPGLLQAWRSGRVLVANAFGASVLEAPAMLGLLPDACERLLGETLEPLAIGTWWCGDTVSLDDASAQSSHRAITSTFPDVPMTPVSFRNPAALNRLEWAGLGGDPESCVVEEILPLSHVPVWHHGRMVSRALVLRVFAVASAGDYRLMSGGLARIAGEGVVTVSNRPGAGSKDTWVIADAPQEPAAAAHARASSETIVTDRAVSSRAAEHLFWLGRYAERAETCARVLRTVLVRLNDPSASVVSRPSFLRTCLAQGLLDASDLEPRKERTAAAAVKPTAVNPTSASALTRRLIDNLFERDARQSLAFNVRHTVRVAGAIRDRLSSDNWRLLNQLFELVATPPRAPLVLHDALGLVDESIISLVAVAGLEMAHMTRDHGWRFLSLGRHLERMLIISATFESVAEDAAEDPALLEWLLQLSDSLVTYRTRYVRPPEWPAVVELLLYDAYNPQSLLFQLGKLTKHVAQLPGSGVVDVMPELTRLERACRAVAVGQQDLFAAPTVTEALLADCQLAAAHVSDAVTSRYFSHAYELPHTTRTGL